MIPSFYVRFENRSREPIFVSICKEGDVLSSPRYRRIPQESDWEWEQCVPCLVTVRFAHDDSDATVFWSRRVPLAGDHFFAYSADGTVVDLPEDGTEDERDRTRRATPHARF